MPFFNRANTVRFASVACSMPWLAACSFTAKQNPMMASVVQSVPLDNGKTLSVGYAAPDAAAGCALVNQTSRNWSMAQTEGDLKFGGGRQVLQEEAVQSVNQRPDAGINYVAFSIPNEAGLGIVNVTVMRDATTGYYHCATPPLAH
jgi:hypothetical protein